MAFKIVKQIDSQLSGWPDQSLTFGLIAVGLVALLVALFSPPSIKILVLAWFVFP